MILLLARILKQFAEQLSNEFVSFQEHFEMADTSPEKRDDGGTRRDYGGRIPKIKKEPKDRESGREDKRDGDADRGRDSRRGREEDRNKERRRHTSRSESESNSQRGSSSDRDRPASASKGTLEERLRAMQGEPGEPRGRWLQKEMEQYKKKHNFDENKPPTEEEIKMQLKLPPRAPDPKNVEFKEPLRQWEVQQRCFKLSHITKSFILGC